LKFPKNKSIPVCTKAAFADETEGKISIVTNDLEVSRTISLRKIEGSYPKYESLLTDVKTRKLKSSVKVNLSFLIELCEVFKMSGEEHILVEVRGEEKDKILVLQNEKEALSKKIGIVMPLRGV